MVKDEPETMVALCVSQQLLNYLSRLPWCLLTPCNVNIKSESFVHSMHINVNIKHEESEGHLVEGNAEKEEDNVEDLVDNHLNKWHMDDIKLDKSK